MDEVSNSVDLPLEIDRKGNEATLKCLEKLPNDWSKQMIMMYDSGCTDKEIMRSFRITPKVWQQLLSDTITSNFAYIVEMGRIFAQAWWEEQGRVGLHAKGFNANLYNINMQNRFGWSSKSEESRTLVEELSNMDSEQLEKRIAELAKNLKPGQVSG